jgi:membrane-associated phospholipid phosphatase
MVQAIGPWSYFGLNASPSQWHYRQVLMALKESREYVIDLNYSEGLICFPSFHAILALLAAIALWQVRGFRWASAIWASMIVVSTVTTGWHYVVDILAGVAVVGISAVGAKAYTAIEVYWTTERAIAVRMRRRTPLAAKTGFPIGRKG